MYEKIFMPKQVDKKEIIWGRIPVLKIPFTKRDLILFVISLPTIYPSFKIYKFVMYPQGIIDNFLMIVTLISIPLLITLLFRIKNNGFYLEKVMFNKFKHYTNAKVSLNEKILNRMKMKED